MEDYIALPVKTTNDFFVRDNSNWYDSIPEVSSDLSKLKKLFKSTTKSINTFMKVMKTKKKLAHNVSEKFSILCIIYEIMLLEDLLVESV
jgi:hypothetical protein